MEYWRGEERKKSRELRWESRGETAHSWVVSAVRVSEWKEVRSGVGRGGSGKEDDDDDDDEVRSEVGDCRIVRRKLEAYIQ